MKIGIFQDVHANLPAFKKGIEIFRENQCDKIYHVGDLIGIGPHPKEVFDLANSLTEIEYIMGNHDHWFGYGLPSPIPKYMNEEEVAHHRWTHAQIGEAGREIVQHWEFVKEIELGNDKRITFQHYGYDPKSDWFKPFIKHPNKMNLDDLFKESTSDIIFYGHNHEASDIQGKRRYVNLGSAGCYVKSQVRVGILEVTTEGLALEKLSVHYEDDGLMEDYEKRDVPAREFITTTFITRQ